MPEKLVDLPRLAALLGLSAELCVFCQGSGIVRQSECRNCDGHGCAYFEPPPGTVRRVNAELTYKQVIERALATRLISIN
jgi:hypothetical protein